MIEPDPLDPSQIVDALQRLDVHALTGLPCSLLGITSTATNRNLYHPVNVEGEAIAACAGMWLGGKLGCALMQNSGLGNAINPIISLMIPYQIPALLLISWRGEPGSSDAVHHAPMGRATLPLLETLDLPHRLLRSGDDPLAALSALRDQALQRRRPAALIIPRGVLTNGEPSTNPTPTSSARSQPQAPTPHKPSQPLDTTAALATICQSLPDWYTLSTTGLISRLLSAQHDAPQRFYMQGSMGFVSTIALGLKLARPSLPTLAIDDNSALLMRLGALATIARANPRGFLHLVLDNSHHASTGNHPHPVDFPQIARACGYHLAHHVQDLESLPQALHTAADASQQGPTLLAIRCQHDPTQEPPRPSLAPPGITTRLRVHLCSHK